jgi:hypothetical protein
MIGTFGDLLSNTNKKSSTNNNSNSYFDNYAKTNKKFGTFNSDGSMNMLGGTFTINGGYKPNKQYTSFT